MTPITKKSLTLEKEPEGEMVWLTGNETVHLVEELLESVEKDPRASGRTKKLALRYCQMALKHPDQRIVIKDHVKTKDANRLLLKMIMEIMNAINIEYEAGNAPEYERDPDSFTGVKATGSHMFFIKAKP